VLAESIDLIRAKFTFDQVPVLIRNNLLQLAIDGFDELVDAEGYKDAWSALKQLFEDTIYGGPIILAGRDSFFDQQSFKKQLESSQYNFKVDHIRLAPVSPKSARQWLARRGWMDKDLRDPYTNIVLRAGSYTLRPFFLRQIADAKSWKAIDSQDRTPRAFLVEKFLAREARLLGSQLTSVPEDVIRQSLSYLFEEIALEMGGNETEAIDLSFLQLVTEAAFSQYLTTTEMSKLIHKSGSFALLESDIRDGYRRFPHTEISHHFLALGLIRTVANGTVTSVLRRGSLSSDFLAIFAELFSKEPLDKASGFIDCINRVLLDEFSFDRLPENLGALAISSLCHEFSSRPREYQDLFIFDAILFGVIAPAKLKRVKIQRLDAREAELDRVDFEDCEVVQLTVDDTTKFGSTTPQVHNLLQTRPDGHVEEIFDPIIIASWLKAHSKAATPEVLVNHDALRLLERICRVMLRQHMIKEHDSDESGRFLKYPFWKSIEEILLREKAIDRIKSKQSAGASASFIRMRDPIKFLVNRDSPAIKRVWDQVGSIPT
jgi:hypothetical protein